jgi:hypothetical protein
MMRTLRGEIHRSTVLRNLQDEIYWGKQYKPLLGSQQNKSTRGRQSNSPGSNETTLLERNESNLLGESKGKLLGIAQSIHKNSAWGNKSSAGEAKTGNSLGIRLIQTSDRIGYALGNNRYSAGDDPHSSRVESTQLGMQVSTCY